jgi:hypothetical protein
MPKKCHIVKLVRELKSYVRKNRHDFMDGMELTIGWNPDTDGWNYQTGDNSFHGAAYGYPIWSLATIDADTDCKSVAVELIDQLEEIHAEQRS